MAHTILMVQAGKAPETRTFSDYESINACMEGICRLFEEHLRRDQSHLRTITYEISELFHFLEQITDISVLVYQKSTSTYAPYGRDWIKEKVYILLRRQASQKD